MDGRRRAQRAVVGGLGRSRPCRAAARRAICELLRDGLGVEAPTRAPASISELELRANPSRAGDSARRWSRSSANGTRAAITSSAPGTRSGRSTIDLLALRARQTAPRAGPGAVPRLARARSLRCSSSARSAMWRSSRSAAARRWSGDWRRWSADRPRRPTGSPAASRSTCGGCNELVELDEQSRLATFGPGLRGPEAEALARPARATRSVTFRSRLSTRRSAGFAAARSSGQASAGYGRFDELVQRTEGRHAGRDPESSEARAEVRGRTRPAPADPRVGGRVRRDHRADGQRPAGARSSASTRAGCCRDFDRWPRDGRAAGPGRSDADRAAAVRRGRDARSA